MSLRGGGGLVCTRHSPSNEVDKDRYRQGANNHVSSAMCLSRQSVAVSQAMCEAIIIIMLMLYIRLCMCGHKPGCIICDPLQENLM